jgi:putative glutathione S-transferase
MTVRPQFPDEQTATGEFARQADAFKGFVTADGRSGFRAESGRYHLYVSLACPWAHRTIIVRALQKLENTIGMTVVDPFRDDLGWRFADGDGFSRDTLNGFTYLSEAYMATDASYRGRVTVPVLKPNVSSATMTTTSCGCSRRNSAHSQAAVTISIPSRCKRRSTNSTPRSF